MDIEQFRYKIGSNPKVNPGQTIQQIKGLKATLDEFRGEGDQDKWLSAWEGFKGTFAGWGRNFNSQLLTNKKVFLDVNMSAALNAMHQIDLQKTGRASGHVSSVNPDGAAPRKLGRNLKSLGQKMPRAPGERAYREISGGQQVFTINYMKGNQARFPDMKIEVDEITGAFLVPGSADQKKNLYNNLNTIGRIADVGVNPYTGKANIVPLSKTYWNVFYQLWVEGKEAQAREWLARAIHSGLSDAMYHAGFRQATNGEIIHINETAGGRMPLPFQTNKKGEDRDDVFTAAQRKALKKGHNMNKHPEKERLGSIMAAAQMYSNVKLLRFMGVEINPRDFTTRVGIDHAKFIENELDKGFARYMDSTGKQAWDEFGFLKYIHPADLPKEKRLQYASWVTPEIKSMHQPLKVIIDKKTGEEKLVVGPMTGAASKDKHKPSVSHSTYTSGPGITIGGKFYNAVTQHSHYPAPNDRNKKGRYAGDFSAGPYAFTHGANEIYGRNALTRKHDKNHMGPADYNNLTYSMRPGNQQTILNHIYSNTPVQEGTRTNRRTVKGVERSFEIPYKGKYGTSASLPRGTRQFLANKGMEVTGTNAYRAALGENTVSDPNFLDHQSAGYAGAGNWYDQTVAAEKRRVEVYGQKPTGSVSNAEWARYAADLKAGLNPVHPYAKAGPAYMNHTDAFTNTALLGAKPAARQQTSFVPSGTTGVTPNLQFTGGVPIATTTRGRTGAGRRKQE